jgi:inositol transporter-like SP family MFS transporter
MTPRPGLGSPAGRLVLVAGSASLLDSAAIISVGSALPLWRTEFTLGDLGAGVVTSSMTIAIAVGALVGGHLADRVGRRRVFAATLGLYAVGALTVACATGWVSLAVGVTVLGLGSGADLPASITLVADRAPDASRGRMVATTHVMWTVGIVVASAAAFSVSPWGLVGMRVVFALLAATSVVTLLARHRALPDLALDRGPNRPSTAPSVPETRASVRALAGIALFYTLYTLVANTYGSFRTYLLVTVGGVSQSVATAVSFGVTLVGLVGTIVFSTIADSPWRRRAYLPAGLALAGSQVALALTVGQSLLATAASLAAYALAYPYVGEGLYKVWAQETASPGRRATFQGSTIAAARAVAALFALLTPSMLTRDPALLFWLLAGFAAAAVVAGSLVMRDGSPTSHVRAAS